MKREFDKSKNTIDNLRKEIFEKNKIMDEKVKKYQEKEKENEYIGKELINEIYKGALGIDLKFNEFDITNLIKNNKTTVYTAESITLNEEDAFYRTVLNKYWNTLNKRAYTYKIKEDIVEYHSKSWGPYLTRRADTIYSENFETGDILIYKNEDDNAYSYDKTKDEPKKEETKPEETKITGKPKTVLIMKFLSEIDKCRPFLTDSDLLKISKISKEFSKNCLTKLKESNNQKISKEEKELEDLNANSANLQNELTFNKLFSKSIENLKSKEDPDYLKKDEVPNEYVLLIYRILLQLINKEKEILKVKDNKEFWKLFKECIIKNSEKGLGAYIENEFKNLDFTEENI